MESIHPASLRLIHFIRQMGISWGNAVRKGADGWQISSFLVRFWTLVSKHMIPWHQLQGGEMTKVDLRENYITTQNVVIQAFGRVGNYLYIHQDEMETALKNIEDIDWHRNAKQWYMRAVGKRGRIITNKKAAMLIANVIKRQTGISLSQEELHAEEALKEIVEE